MLQAIARFSMATNEKSHGMLLHNGKRQSEELARRSSPSCVPILPVPQYLLERAPQE